MAKPRQHCWGVQVKDLKDLGKREIYMKTTNMDDLSSANLRGNTAGTHQLHKKDMINS